MQKYIEKNIEDVQPDEVLVGYDIEAGQFVESNFTQTMTPRDVQTIRITFTDSTFVDCTADHPFFMTDGTYKVVSYTMMEANHSDVPHEWEELSADVSGEFGVGDVIVGYDSLKTVQSIENLGIQTVYHLMGSDTKNFIANGLIAHNMPFHIKF